MGNFSSEFRLFQYNEDSNIEINVMHSYDVPFNLQTTAVNVLNNLIQFQNIFNSILEPNCQNKLWCDQLQLKKRKTKFQIL